MTPKIPRVTTLSASTAQVGNSLSWCRAYSVRCSSVSWLGSKSLL